MKDASIGLGTCKPEFLWDAERSRLIWANEAGLAFWGEDDLAQLSLRWFAPGGQMATDLSRLGSKGSGEIALAPQGALIIAQAAAKFEGPHLRIVLNDFETPSRLEAPYMSNGFEFAPRPLAVFDAAGVLITQNEADRLSFGPLDLGDRLGDPKLSAQALGVALIDESYSHVYEIGDNADRWRINFRRMRDADGSVTVLAEFNDVPQVLQDGGLDARALASVAHDFRAPLTAIRGFAEFLANGAAPPDRQAAYLQAIQSAAIDLTALADKFVTLGQSASGRLTLLDLNTLAQNVAGMNEVAAVKAETTIVVRADPLAKPVLCDPVSARRIVENLVSNALRHGGSAITLTVAGVSITVADDGDGMAQAELDAALGGEHTSNRGGIGLPNCVSLAADMAADIRFETNPGQGFAARLSFAP